MKKFPLNKQLPLLIFLILMLSCGHSPDPLVIAKNTIHTIDTIGTIVYHQTLLRGNTGTESQGEPRERIFYHKRLISDSITGAMTHIYFYDSNSIYHEDIYDGNRLVRKHNIDSTARVYDLLKYPEFRNQPFWGKTTPYTMQYMLGYALNNKEHYIFELGKDTIINDLNCYCLRTILKGKALMPGFHEMTDDSSRVETMVLFIDKLSCYPQSMRLEAYFTDDPRNIYFTDHHFYNLKFNMALNDSLFNTSTKILSGFAIKEIKPD